MNAREYRCPPTCEHADPFDPIRCPHSRVYTICFTHLVWYPEEDGNCPTCRGYIAAGL